MPEAMMWNECHYLHEQIVGPFFKPKLPTPFEDTTRGCRRNVVNLKYKYIPARSYYILAAILAIGVDL